MDAHLNRRWLAVAAAVGAGVGLAACTADAPAVDAPAVDAVADAPADAAADATTAAPGGTSWPAADALFRQDPRWLGGDAAYSIDLGDDRVLWLMGDSFIATSAAHVRAESVMVRNSIGVQTGRDPTTATMTMAWGEAAGGAPASYFAERGDRWHWPMHGVRIPDGPLIVFVMVLRPTPGEGLGFASDGWRAARIADPDGAPATWAVEWLEPPAQAFDAVVGAAVVVDGDHVVALAPRASGGHDAALARWPIAALAAGELADLEWWDGAAWTAATALVGAPAIVLPAVATEGSLHHDPDRGWVHVASRGFGATTIAVRTAPALTGPWSAAVDVFTPPESLDPAPADDAFVYAGKAHPELAGAGAAMIVTYAANSFDFADLFTPAGAERLYWPRFATITLAAP